MDNSSLLYSPGMAPPVEKSLAPAFEFTGQTVPLLWVYIKNVLLISITLGVYYTWAKTNVRRFMWQHSVLLGRPLEYTGTGLEMFIGLLLVSLVFALFTGAGTLFSLFLPAYSHVFPVIFYALMGFLVPVAIHRSLRYRLTRTKWCGIRLNLDGNTRTFVRIFLWRMFISCITLGIAHPESVMQIHRQIVNKTRMGSQNFQFTASRKSFCAFYYPLMIGSMLLLAGLGWGLVSLFESSRHAGGSPEAVSDLFGPLVFVFGLILFALTRLYGFFMLRWRLSGIELGGVQLHSRMRLGGYALLQLGNLLILIGTLGIGYAWTRVRLMRFIAQNLYFSGQLDEARILQDTASIPKFGEGLAESLDLGIGL